MATVKNKLLSLIFLASVLLLCVSCQSDPPQSEPAEESAVETEHVHSPVSLQDVPPTCEADGHTGGIQCATCKYYIELPVSVEKLGHTCKTGLCERCKKWIVQGKSVPEEGIWKQGYFKDIFGDPTDEKCIFTDRFYGVFSNSATNGSELGVQVYVTLGELQFQLIEYDRFPVTSSIYSMEAHVKYLDMKETFYPEFRDGVLVIEGTMFEKIWAALATGINVEFAISETGGTSLYRFILEASNFAATYTSAFLVQ